VDLPVQKAMKRIQATKICSPIAIHGFWISAILAELAVFEWVDCSL
jgi:hypothetical protein